VKETLKDWPELDPVRPAKPVAPWIGGKRVLAHVLAEKIAAVPHVRYVEPFVGMGGVFLRRRSRPKLEVINDINRDVVNLFRILQRHYQQFLDVLKWQVCSRAEFERLAAVDSETLTDLERAARFLYLQRSAFGGKLMGQSFGVAYEGGARFDLTKLVPVLEDVHERLAGVLIERLPYAECIRRYDSRPGTLFYCDPPYWGSTGDYGKDLFSEADFHLLRDLLAGLQGRFILSINDTPEVRAIFAGFAIEEVRLNYRVSGQVTPARELIISGPCPSGVL
jgi:DNA adenine methylase